MLLIMIILYFIMIVLFIIIVTCAGYDTGYDEGVRDTERAYIYKFCEKCANYKTTNCPNTSKCFSTLDKPYFKIKENKNV